MTYLLDTCICIYLIRQKSSEIKQKFDFFSVGDLCVSSITESELRYGAEKSTDPNKNHRKLDQFFLTLPVIPFSHEAAVKYGKIRAVLEKSGTPIGPYDLLIAAHAMSLDLILVTNNTKEFSRIPSLILEDWVNP